VKEAQKWLAKAFVRLEALEAELLTILAELEQIDPPVRPRAVRREGKCEAALRKLAERGARSLEIAVEGNVARARLEGEEWFDLPERVAMLLLIISDDSSRDADGFPVWRTSREISALLNKAAHLPKIGPRGVSNLVWRLRRELTANGANKFWVETAESKKGVRFRHRGRVVEFLDEPPSGPVARQPTA